ncbi:MmgE/PrpD family protein [Roseiarcaceae bacterium H3SJ34-1]|uniref:MmgE/PrpD family protein n=1 Tax=Terripilifer ovatus TaxID=3032367 RepID=UPI003AB98453|nr:MmgE/PrpD family protein [Roseiarcaceae bacterium H3SJ34-1]
MPTLSEQLAAFGHELSFEQIPEDVTSFAKLLVLDLLGVALAAKTTEEWPITLAACLVLGGASESATLWGTGRKSTPQSAALFNGIVAHALELDDFNGVDHSGAVVLPALFAAAEMRPDVTGAQLLTAMVFGYEVGRRLLDAAGGYRVHNAAGWHTTGTCGSFAAAAAVAKLWDLPPKDITWALGVAGSFTGGVWAFGADGAMSKRYHAGRAAETGLVAATLASQGFTGPKEIFEAPWGGYANTYAAGNFDASKMVSDLGEDLRLAMAGIKPYACCRGLHSTVDAVLAMRQEPGFDADAISDVGVRCTPGQAVQLGNGTPVTRLQAQFSLPYSFAVAAIKGRASLAEFSGRLDDRATRELAARVRIQPEPDLGKEWEPELTVSLSDGTVLTKQVNVALGDARNPLPRAAVINKYRGLMELGAKPESAAEIEEITLGLEAPAALGRLLTLLS